MYMAKASDEQREANAAEGTYRQRKGNQVKQARVDTGGRKNRLAPERVLVNGKMTPMNAVTTN